MKVTSIKTHKITKKDKNIFKILDKYLPKLKEKSVVAVTSKIIAICEGRVVRKDLSTKDKLVEQEAEWYLPRHLNKYDFCISIKNNTFTASAGVDESNGNGYYVLWPSNPQRSANDIRGYLKRRFSLKEVGVIITDSKTTPLRWGVTGVALAHSGFSALNSYIGKPDVFGRLLKAEKLNVSDTLATAAVGVMGEGNEQTPIAIIEDLPFVKFKKGNPSQRELAGLHIKLEDDLYAPLLKGVKWKRGKGG
ncbi:MAG: coenzyme F420-0:L-glutamate ligase [bacterium]|nr:coenzyme F420-0:L-glutamate ligase [bacterium]